MASSPAGSPNAPAETRRRAFRLPSAAIAASLAPPTFGPTQGFQMQEPASWQRTCVWPLENWHGEAIALQEQSSNSIVFAWFDWRKFKTMSN